jgi:hypothetical protein
LRLRRSCHRRGYVRDDRFHAPYLQAFPQRVAVVGLAGNRLLRLVD